MPLDVVLAGADAAVLDDAAARLRECLARHELPRAPEDLGLSVAQFAAAVSHAPATRPDRYTVLENLGLDEQETLDRVTAFAGWARVADGS